eukprot:c26528_g1_i2 orf=333-803(-)
MRSTISSKNKYLIYGKMKKQMTSNFVKALRFGELADMAGICLCSTAWREGHPDLACLLSSMLESSPYRMKFQSIVPDFIFNSGGISVAFVLLIDWTDENLQRTFERSAKIKERFRNCHVILTVPSDEVNQSFLRSYFRGCRIAENYFGLGIMSEQW